MKNKILLIIILFAFCKCTVENENIYVIDCDKLGENEVKICDQIWSTKNLDVDHYRNGDSIPEVRDATEWANLKTGAWCYYNNDTTLGAIYGKLYNWYAVNDPRGLAPAGWHVPSDGEWIILEMCLGMSQTEANKTGYRGTDEYEKLKESGTAHWQNPNAGATNESGFTALPGGYRYINGGFAGLGYGGSWWTSTNITGVGGADRDVGYGKNGINRGGAENEDGVSVRCVKD